MLFVGLRRNAGFTRCRLNNCEREGSMRAIFVLLVFLGAAVFAYCALNVFVRDIRRRDRHPKADPNKTEAGNRTYGDASFDRSHDHRDTNPAGNQPEQYEGEWIGATTLVVLYLTFCAAVYAAIEGKRLADLTIEAITHADDATTTQHTDTLEALKVAQVT